jgi:hypothetical protein
LVSIRELIPWLVVASIFVADAVAVADADAVADVVHPKAEAVVAVLLEEEEVI